LSVYKHEYRAYTGPVTSLRSRIGVLARYALAEAWSSKITLVLFAVSMIPVVVFLLGIYLANNPIARALIVHGGSARLDIDASFFLKVLNSQCWLALVLTAWIAPRLVSFDLADNALPILLSHPISRFGYVLGKFIALFSSLSLVTWIPSLLLFAYQGYTSPRPWVGANLRIAVGLLAGSVLWIALLSILGLALSSWVKWRMVATGSIFAAVLIPAGVGGVVSAILRTKWGFLLNLPVMMSQLWQRLMGTPESIRIGRELPNAAIAAMLVLICFVCVIMLNARIRAREVVRG
jgi:ABC-type transport system involved in multi-copper enzyme maturation permease subunit